MYDVSVSMIVPASKRDDCRRLMRGLGYDDAPDPGRSFPLPLTVNDAAPATHHGAHIYDERLADILASGILPLGIDWGAYGLTLLSAQEALGAIRYGTHANRAPVENFAALMASEGAKRIKTDEI